MTSLVSRGVLASQENQDIVLKSRKQNGGRGLTQKQASKHAPSTRKALGDLDNSSSVQLPLSKALKPSVTKSKKVGTSQKHTVKSGRVQEVAPPPTAPVVSQPSDDLSDIESLPSLNNDTFSAFEEPLYFKSLAASLKHTTVTTPFPNLTNITSATLTLRQRPLEPWEDILGSSEPELRSGVSEPLPAMPDIDW